MFSLIVYFPFATDYIMINLSFRILKIIYNINTDKLLTSEVRDNVLPFNKINR
jgi:hypothetical protein